MLFLVFKHFKGKNMLVHEITLFHNSQHTLFISVSSGTTRYMFSTFNAIKVSNGNINQTLSFNTVLYNDIIPVVYTKILWMDYKIQSKLKFLQV